MGKLQNFTVQFHDNKVIYNPGNAVNGSIIINLERPMTMKAVKIKFQGKGNVSWHETHSTGKTTYTVHYHSKEYYFKQEVSVFGEGSTGDAERATELPAGQNVFPFQFVLPPNLPSSFEGKHGYVRYIIHAAIERPWKFDPKTKAAFTVLDMLDLNSEPNAKTKSQAEDSKTICCLCCASGAISGEVNLDKTGYVPGEFIVISATAKNESVRKLKATKAAIIQKVSFMAHSPRRKTRTATKTIAEIEGPGLQRHQTIQWSNERVQVPPVPPSELRHCNIINIQYYLEFSIVLPKLSRNLRVKAPIILGTIPLQGLPGYSELPMPQPTFPDTGELPMQPMPTAPPGPAPSTYMAPPPSYMAAVGGEVDIKDDDDNEHMMGGTTFAPQYTYYDWSQSAFTYN